MARFQGGRQFKAALQTASIEAIQMAAEYLKDMMVQLVNIQCPVAGGGRKDAFGAGHSPSGGPPYKETGYGQSTIKMVRTTTGAQVGVTAMEGIGGMFAENYMAGWDSPRGIRGARRPWLSLWKRYEPEMTQIIRRHMKMRTGAT